MRAPSARVIYWAATLGGAVPGLWLWWQYHTGALGVVPDEVLLHQTGRFGLTFLMGTLAIGFAHFLTGWGVIFAARRPLGVWAFAYALSHALIWGWFDQGGTLAFMRMEIAEMRHVQLGLAALLLMAPLALSSFNAAQRMMTLRRWKWLHLLTWPTAVLAVFHAWSVARFEAPLVTAMGAALALMMLTRLFTLAQGRRPRPR